VAERCVKLGCPEFIRLALQDPCSGEPIPGATNGALISCARNSNLEKVLQDPEISTFTSDCNRPDRYVQDAQLLGFNTGFEVASLSPQLESLLNGDDLIVDTGVNIGVFYDAAASCSTPQADPRFIAEYFYKVRQCDAGGGASYVRYVVTGVRFQPSEIDKESQITFARYTGTSDPTLYDGLTAINNGPFDDFPAAVVADINAKVTADPNASTFGFWFVDDTDPVAGLTLAANSCYTAVVPA
jgi:hypothetical protein